MSALFVLARAPWGVFALAACLSMAGCASPPARQADMDYRSRPSSSASPGTAPSGQRLTIQAGEGERLNLPWFIQDAEDWVNKK
ncbi:hypothetical protein [Bordetella genomosp. 12]|uniref:Lipoprotein n=1 Tax=Bordetella genomosp. 12 TaxID=463035 RepID=A0A261VEF4_9BORD|nr:hypothetical protein [Bordetella genomosp. 12]OZI71543.1 hypothetical protein CAL22_17165 [Bordetella genomosp. 12]